jgi:peptidoglycan/LPS O-acetylase OafA/YrhL
VLSAAPRYLPGLDVVRALAALAVLACHVVQATTVWSPVWLASAFARFSPLITTAMEEAGAWGVGIFFVLSGLCIHLPLARHLAHGAPPKVELGSYLKRRFKRIYPPHLVVLLLSAALALVLPLAAYGVHPMISVPTRVQLAAHLVMLHTFLPNAFYSINHVLWTIALEAHFYLLYPLLILARRKRSMGVLCACLFALSIAVHLGTKALGFGPVVRAILEQSVACRFWEWVLGCWLAERIATRGVKLGTRHWAIFGGLFATWLVAAIGRDTVPYGTMILPMVMPPVFAFALYAACGMSVREGSALVRVGTASYSLYLVHPIALSLVLVGLRAAGASSVALEMVACVAGALLAMTFFHKYVERSFMPKAKPAVTAAVTPQAAA